MAFRSRISRRDFLRWTGASAAAVGFAESFLPRLAEAMQEAVKERS